MGNTKEEKRRTKTNPKQLRKCMRYHLTLVRMAIIKISTKNKRWKGCGEKGTLLPHWWECKWIQPLWRTVWRFFKKLNIELPYNTEIPLLDIYTVKTIIQKDTCTPMFIAALFTIVSTWKQLKCPSTEASIKKMWYRGDLRRWQKSNTWRSPSYPQIHQKYIYTWNCSYRTPTAHWQKNSDLPKGKKLSTYLSRAKEKRKNKDKRIGRGPAPVGGSCEGGKVSTH